MLCLVAQHVRLFLTTWTVVCWDLLSMEILQARILQWVVMPSSRGSSQPRSPALRADFLRSEPPEESKNTGVDSLSLIRSIFWTQELNLGLLHCRQILYQLSHKGIPRILEWVAYPFSRGSSNPGIEPRSPKETEPVIKIPVPNSFTSEFYQIFKEKWMAIHLKLFEKT